MSRGGLAAADAAGRELSLEVRAFLARAADSPAEGQLSPGQATTTDGPSRLAQSLSTRLSRPGGPTTIVVFPEHGSLDGTSREVVWTSTHAEVTGIAPTATRDELVARLNHWYLSRPRTTPYRTLVPGF